MTETTLPTEMLPDLPVSRDCPYRPPAGYDDLRRRGPVTQVRLYDGRAVWFVSGYAAARALLADTRLSSDRANPDMPRTVAVPSLERLRRGDSLLARVGSTLIGADPPEHGRQRRLLMPSFSVRRVNALRPGIRRIVDERLDAMLAAGPPTDLVAAFALPVPSMVICELLGVPYADHELFEEHSRRILDPEQAGDAFEGLWRYMDELVTRKEAEPGGGVIDDLIRQRAEEPTLTRDQLLALALILLVAGHITTTNMISLGVLALLEHPAQLAVLRRPDADISAAVEELLRYLSIINALPRVATADVEVAGQVIRADDGVLIANAAANYDEARFAGAGALDVTRSPQHIAFGYGIHQCLGQNLARAEMEIAFTQLLERVPTLGLAVPADEVGPMSSFLAGVTALPVRW